MRNYEHSLSKKIKANIKVRSRGQEQRAGQERSTRPARHDGHAGSAVRRRRLQKPDHGAGIGCCNSIIYSVHDGWLFVINICVSTLIIIIFVSSNICF